MTEVKVVTRGGEETMNLQPEETRMYYEIQGIARMIKEKDFKECHRRLDVMLNVIETLEKTRKAAGIFFTGEKEMA